LNFLSNVTGLLSDALQKRDKVNELSVLLIAVPVRNKNSVVLVIRNLAVVEVNVDNVFDGSVEVGEIFDVLSVL
jgi:hypothetical protein